MPEITKAEAIQVLLDDKPDDVMQIASNRDEYTFDDMVNDFCGMSQGFISDSAGLEYRAIKAISTLYGNDILYTPQRILKMQRDISTQVANPSVPWLSSSIDKRYSFIFRENVRFEGDKSKLDAIRAIPGNHNFLKPVWNEQFNRMRDMEGNVFIGKVVKTGRLFFIPFANIANIYVDNFDDGLITHLKLTTGNSYSALSNQQDTKTYIIKRYNNAISDYNFRKATKEKDPIHNDIVFYDCHTAKKPTEPLAIPPLLLSTLYCSAAARYYADTSRYIHSVSLVALKAVAATKDAAKRGVEEIAAIKQAGAIAGMSGDYQLATSGTNGMNIAANSGVSWLSAAAASVNIPVSQYMGSTQGLGGTAGSLVTLDTPTKSYYASQRAIITDFFQEIIGDGIDISFVANPADSVIKNVTSATTAYNNFAIHQDEYREFVIDQLNIENPRDELPEIPEIPTPDTGSNTPTAVSRQNGHDGEPKLDGSEV